MAESRLIAGAMSGTSADGVDVAITRVTGTGLEMTAEVEAFHAQPYSVELKRAIFAMRESGNTSLAELARVGREISLAYAVAANRAIEIAGVKSGEIAAVAAHGQTLYHAPPDTIQWLDPALIAAETGCAVVSDFRRADCAAGGQGAPLVPFADYILFRHPQNDRVLLNIGGIANLTYIPAGASIEDLIAFDTGPGNCVSDWLCRSFDPHGPGYDEHGYRAARGKLIDPFQFHDAVPYFSKRPPKSTDIPSMIAVAELKMRFLGIETESVPLDDLLHTACAWTAQTVKRALHFLPPKGVKELIVSGGGTRNQTLMSLLAASVSQMSVMTIDQCGVQSQAKEALAFAILGAATLDNFPSNVPSCTGARRKVVLGSITPRP